PVQFYIAAAAAVALGLYAFTLPPAPPRLGRGESRALVDVLGLSSFRLFRDRNMAVFFFFAMLLGAALQLTNAEGGTFLGELSNDPQSADHLAVRSPAIILSIALVSEPLLILAVPFFGKPLGVKVVVTLSMLAWCVRVRALA